MRNALILSLALAAGCTDDDGSAPTISSLAFSPATVIVGQQTTISGTLAFADPDGDLVDLGVELTLPDQSTQTLPMTPLQNVGTMTDGSVAWSLFVAPPAAGTYGLALWLVDASGHASNRLAGTLQAQ